MNKYQHQIEQEDHIDEIDNIASRLGGTANDNLDKIKEQNKMLDALRDRMSDTQKTLSIQDLKMKEVLDIVGKSQWYNLMKMAGMLLFLILQIIFL